MLIIAVAFKLMIFGRRVLCVWSKKHKIYEYGIIIEIFLYINRLFCCFLQFYRFSSTSINTGLMIVLIKTDCWRAKIFGSKETKSKHAELIINNLRILKFQTLTCICMNWVSGWHLVVEEKSKWNFSLTGKTWVLRFKM